MHMNRHVGKQEAKYPEARVTLKQWINYNNNNNKKFKAKKRLLITFKKVFACAFMATHLARLAGLHLVAAARQPLCVTAPSPRCCLHLYSPSALFSCLLCLPLLFPGSVLSLYVRLRPTYRHSKHPISVPVPCTMWAALQARASVSSWWLSSRQWKLAFSSSSSAVDAVGKCTLDLHEIEKVLTDVKADDVKVIPSPKHCDWADFMVLATGRSTWHVKNIAQALIYKAKQKQKGADRMMLPSVEGQAGGKWIVIDSGKVIVHALDEKARAYYNLEGLWTSPERLRNEPIEDLHLQNALVKIRRKNNSKKPAQRNA
ncbi:Protein Iojap-related [Arachis hypogaea]|nr:Protein Iojap-related [Arachis hypogaea]